MEWCDHKQTNICSLNKKIFKSPFVNFYNVNLKALLNKQLLYVHKKYFVIVISKFKIERRDHRNTNICSLNKKYH